MVFEVIGTREKGQDRYGGWRRAQDAAGTEVRFRQKQALNSVTRKSLRTLDCTV